MFTCRELRRVALSFTVVISLREHIFFVRDGETTGFLLNRSDAGDGIHPR